MNDIRGGVDGIRISQFTHHSCTVGSQRMRQVKSAILENMVGAIREFVPEKGVPGGTTKLLQDRVKEASGIELTVSQHERVEQATNQLITNLIDQLSKKDARGRYLVLDNTGKRKKAAMNAAHVFFLQAGKDLAPTQ